MDGRGSPSVWDESKEMNRVVQGDGSVIILPDGKCMMVDAFDSEGKEDLVEFIARRDIGSNIVACSGVSRKGCRISIAVCAFI